MTAELRQPGTPTGTAGNGAAFTFTQDVASALWLVGHNLGMRPNVTVVDTLEREFEGDVEYVDDDNITISFARPTTGKAYLS